MSFARWLYTLPLRVRSLFRRSDVDRDLDDEMQYHLERLTQDNIAHGMPQEEARYAALRSMDGLTQNKEKARETWKVAGITNFIGDVRLALRVLGKSLGFSSVAVVTLAVAIGANAVVFAVLNALILRPLNVPRAESLYGVERGRDKAVNHSYPDYLDLRDRNRSFEDLAAYNVTAVGLDTGNNQSSAWILEVTGNYFDALGIQPYLGRFFHSADEHGANSAPYIVLTYAFWHSHFQDDRGVVGRVVLLNKRPFTILGVAPPEFRGTLAFVFPDFWVPIVNQEQIEGMNALNERSNRGSILMVLGHLKVGVTPAQAVADLNSIGSYLEKTYPKDDSQMTFSLMRPGLAGDWLGDPLKAFLTGLMMLAGLILLAACANLGSLFAARAADRSREIALRLALGSSRNRILRQLLTEALVISFIGGAAGLWGSIVLLRGFSVWEPLPTAPIHIPVYPDAKVYALALLLALVSGLLFGIVPVRQVLRANPYGIVKSGSTGPIGRQFTVRDLLVAVQIAICAVLVTSSLVAVRGLVRSLHTEFGFNPQNAMLVETDLNMAGYGPDQVPAMQKRMIDALQGIRGVRSVGIVDRPPLYYGANDAYVFHDKTTDLSAANAAADAVIYNISPEYFDAAGTTLLAGRIFTWHDDKKAPRVAVINQQFARKIFGSVSSAMSGYYKLHDGSRIQVVGMVEDGRYASLAEDPRPAMFLPILQSPSSANTFVVRSNGDQQQIAAAIKNKVEELDAGLPFTLRTWSHELESALFPSRMATLSLGVLGMMGALLSITGIFGMAAYSVSKRQREIGIRVALGAQSRGVLQTALGRAVRLLAIGSTAGLLLGILASRVLASIVYQATPRDPFVLAGAVLAMALVGLLATWIPARRALRVDPLILLREE